MGNRANIELSGVGLVSDVVNRHIEGMDEEGRGRDVLRALLGVLGVAGEDSATAAAVDAFACARLNRHYLANGILLRLKPDGILTFNYESTDSGRRFTAELAGID